MNEPVRTYLRHGRRTGKLCVRQRRRLLAGASVSVCAGYPAASAHRSVDRRTSSLPRPAFAVWLFKERSQPRREKSGSGARGQASQFFSTWPGFPRPADVLAPAEDGAVALGLRQGPDLGVHHPAAHRLAASPAPPPSPDPRSGPGFPRERCRDYGEARGGWG
jgi:hypothetical protein